MDRKRRQRCGDVGIRTSTVDLDSCDQRWKGVILWALMYNLRLKDKYGLQGRTEGRRGELVRVRNGARASRLTATSQGQDKVKKIWLCVRTT
jgi:hypothetical protein